MSDNDQPEANRGNAGKGRIKGSQNKFTKAIKEMVLEALDGAHPEGGVGYLKEQAAANPVAFMGLLGRILPMQVQGPGANGEHIVEIAWRVVDPAD